MGKKLPPAHRVKKNSGVVKRAAYKLFGLGEATCEKHRIPHCERCRRTKKFI